MRCSRFWGGGNVQVESNFFENFFCERIFLLDSRIPNISDSINDRNILLDEKHFFHVLNSQPIVDKRICKSVNSCSFRDIVAVNHWLTLIHCTYISDTFRSWMSAHLDHDVDKNSRYNLQYYLHNSFDHIKLFFSSFSQQQ